MRRIAWTIRNRICLTDTVTVITRLVKWGSVAERCLRRPGGTRPLQERKNSWARTILPAAMRTTAHMKAVWEGTIRDVTAPLPTERQVANTDIATNRKGRWRHLSPPILIATGMAITGVDKRLLLVLLSLWLKNWTAIIVATNTFLQNILIMWRRYGSVNECQLNVKQITNNNIYTINIVINKFRKWLCSRAFPII